MIGETFIFLYYNRLIILWQNLLQLKILIFDQYTDYEYVLLTNY